MTSVEICPYNIKGKRNFFAALRNDWHANRCFMYRKINNINYFFICQIADWQYAIEAADFEEAISNAVFKVMNANKKNSFSEYGIVKKVSNNINSELFQDECRKFYMPLILADAGFHTESANLKNHFKNDI